VQGFGTLTEKAVLTEADLSIPMLPSNELDAVNLGIDIPWLPDSSERLDSSHFLAGYM